MKNILTIISVALVAIAIYMKFFATGQGKVGEESPEVEATLISGTPFKLSSLKGKKVYLVFWGSWCAPCRAELPHWVEFYRNNQDPNVEIVSIALEKKEGASQRVADMLGFNWKYQIEEVSGFVALNGFAKKYGVTDIPAAFEINANNEYVGKVSAVPSY